MEKTAVNSDSATPGDSSIPANQPTAARLPRWKRWLFRLGALAIGCMLFLLLELTCYLCGWGEPQLLEDPFVGFASTQPLFEHDPQAGIMRVADSRRNFFAEETFPAEKADGTFRIFCLGGSTVQGRPYSLPTAFPKWLEISLDQAGNGRRYEVINCGGISYASYRLVPILEECLKYQPDLFIVCTGQNEFLEDRSYAHIKESSAVWLKTVRTASRFRTFNLMRQLLGHRVDVDENAKPVLQADADPILNYHDSLKLYQRDPAWQSEVATHFEFNLRRMVAILQRKNIPLVFVQPPVNLADCRPFKSQHRDGLSAVQIERWQELMDLADTQVRSDLQLAVQTYRKAIDIDPQYALVWYRLGRCYRSLGLYSSAIAAFQQAIEHDICPLRMTSALRERLQTVAGETGTPLLNVQELFERESPHGLVDGRWLVDHVHPSVEGHQRVATALTETLLQSGHVRGTDGWPARRKAAFADHLATLDDFYFLKADRVLEAVHCWTTGASDGPPAAERFPHRAR